jgi:hypothetical protein
METEDMDMAETSSEGTFQEATGNPSITRDAEIAMTEATNASSILILARSIMPQEQETTQAKRKLIRTIMIDNFLSERERSLRIQQLMDGSNPNAIRDQLQQEQQNELQQAAANGEISQNNIQALQLAVATGAAIPCVHYERKCNIVAPCCGKIYGCRVCHDELSNSLHGQMDRFLINEIICKECNTRQGCSNQCVNPVCAVIFAEYHCDLCNLWMGLSNDPFHCHKCGFCRVGGAENYHHCDQCSMCINADTLETHACLQDKVCSCISISLHFVYLTHARIYVHVHYPYPSSHHPCAL